MASGKIEKRKPTLDFTESVKSLSATSARGETGWVLRFDGVDSYDNTIRIGFDAQFGVYCYFNDTLLWNIRP